VYLKRELLEGLGIDPDTLEVRIRVQGPGEQERQPGGGGAARSAVRAMGGQKLSGKLLEAFSLLCQAVERFVSYMARTGNRWSGRSTQWRLQWRRGKEDACPGKRESRWQVR
jgi:hypothetical protein